jgi:hypothetical protein
MNTNGGGRQPDFILKVGLRGEKYHKRCGAAWTIQNGGLSLKIDPGIALVSGTDVLVTLWPFEEQRRQPKSPHTLEDDDDQIPY